MPMARKTEARMLAATRPAAMTGSTMSAAMRRMPTIRIESAIVTPARPATTTFSAATGTPATRAPSSSITTAASAR